MCLLRLLFILLLISGLQPTWAEETDQFTLPPQDLEDIGPFASNRLYTILEQVRTQTNTEIQRFSSQSGKHAAKELALRLKGNYLANLLYKKTGPGFPRWLRWGSASNQSKPFLYREIKPWNTVYWLVFSQSPLSLIGLAPTINMYQVYFGTDKLGHFFMQGHTYYTLYMYFLNHGKTAEQAHQAIITYGQILEQTYLGTLVNGVYSNADLSANYAGWKFYMNLTQSVAIGKQILPPIFILKSNQWEFNTQVHKDNLLKPYLSDNLNEALNPCRYAFMRNHIRKQVQKRCADWIQRRGITKPIIEAKLEANKRWHGEAYGHWLPQSNAVTLNSCFGQN